MMHVVVVAVSQGLSFETGEAANHVTLLLPNGRKVMAAVSEDTVAELTHLFINGGGPAAQVAIANATSSADPSPPPDVHMELPPTRTREQPEEQVGSYSPMNFADGGSSDEETVSTFGGDVTDPDLEAVGRSLQQAEHKLAHAIGDTSSMGPAELRQVVSRIQEATPNLPVPSFAAQPPAPGRRLQGPKVQADERGNPIISGPGLVDYQALTGGNTEGEEDVGQV